jgi:hypothetical protein
MTRLANYRSGLSSLVRDGGRGICFFCVALLAFTSNLAAQEKITLKRLPSAILKMDGKQVKFWDLYRAEKRGNLLLVQLGGRYLLLDTKEREVVELNASAIASKPKGEVVVTRGARSETPVESDAWSLRNVGPAMAIKVYLTKEGRQLEVQVPLRPDERRLW